MNKKLILSNLKYLLLILITLLLVSCQKKQKYTYFGPTEEFYINDRAGALLSYTKWNIFINGESLYVDSLEDPEIPNSIRGAQVVVLTLLEKDEFVDTTTIFNEFGIGKNDMGIFLVLIFSEGEEFLELKSITLEIGSNMMGYFSMFDMTTLINEHFFDPIWNDNYDIQLLVLYHEIIGKIYTDIYGYNSYTYNTDIFYEELYEYYGLLPSEKKGVDLFGLIYLDIPLWLFIVILLIIPSTLGGIFGFKSFINRSGGGSSLGYKFTRGR